MKKNIFAFGYARFIRKIRIPIGATSFALLFGGMAYANPIVSTTAQSPTNLSTIPITVVYPNPSNPVTNFVVTGSNAHIALSNAVVDPNVPLKEPATNTFTFNIMPLQSGNFSIEIVSGYLRQKGETTGASNLLQLVYAGGLPNGVTLQQIDGGPNYYASNGLTNAHNNGWDDPNFFPIGAWAAPISSPADATRWSALGWNTAYVPAYANQSVIQNAGVSLVISIESGWGYYGNYGFTPGPETVGIETYDEPQNSAQFYNGMSTVANSLQDDRFWWVNNTINWIMGYGPSPSGQQGAWLAAPQTTPDGAKRAINVSSLDYYPFTRNDQYGPPSVSAAWGLSAPATPDQYRRGFFYRDVLDQQRLFQVINTPLVGIVENGGPFDTDSTASTYIQPTELNWAVWESIIGGARSILYFNNTFGGPGGSDDNMNNAYYQSPQVQATFTGMGSGTNLTVSNVNGRIFLGDSVNGPGVANGTKIISQSSGTEGGAGVYVTNQATTANGSSLSDIQPVSMYAQTAATDNLVAQLAPVINSPFAKGYATVNPASGEQLPLPLSQNTKGSAFSGVDISVHWYQGGSVNSKGLQLENGAYIIAATRESEYATNIPATFTLADKNATSVTVINENRSLPVTNGIFTDNFATGSTIHIYQVH